MSRAADCETARPSLLGESPATGLLSGSDQPSGRGSGPAELQYPFLGGTKDGPGTSILRLPPPRQPVTRTNGWDLSSFQVRRAAQESSLGWLKIDTDHH